MGRPFIFAIPYTPRAFLHIRYRPVIVLLILSVLQQQHFFFLNRQALAAKYASTKFTSNSPEAHPRFLRPDDEDSHFQAQLLANREAWKVLGEGWEGKVFVYKDSVIKTFTPGRSPFRNCAPGRTDSTWPTEILASLHFGGFYQKVDNYDESRPYNASSTAGGFLPVQAYFLASPLPRKPAEWHLVTPFLRGGNLNTLAHSLSNDTITKTFREIDATYRPAFNRLVEDMARLHDAGYCHDDMKPANIFIQDQSHWVIGDLGNIRHVLHPYHSSRLWRNNQQLQDCRANDVIRALKSYVKFIQTSVGDTDQFNNAFFEAKEPISRLFWWALADAPSMSAARLRQRSFIEYPEAPCKSGFDGPLPSPTRHTLMSFFSRRAALQHAVDHVLVTRMGEKVARWWAMTWLFGVPSLESCEVSYP